MGFNRAWMRGNTAPRQRPRLARHGLAAGAVAGVIAVIAGGISMASVSSPLALRGCYSDRTGALRLLTRAGAACGRGERAVSWSEASISWRGTWHAGTFYAAGDAVSYSGSSYLATRNSSGKYPPLSPQFWSLLAASGQPGPPGPQGSTGPSGAAGSPGPTGSPGTGLYAHFYNIPGDDFPVSALSYIPFPSTGSENGTLITPAAGNKFTLARGTYTVTVCVSFAFAGSYQLTLSSAVLTFPVLGSVAAGTNAPVCTTAVVQSDADSDDNLGVQATSDDVVSGGSDSTIVIQAISTQ